MKGFAAPMPLIHAFRAWVIGQLPSRARQDAAVRPRLGRVALVGAGPGSADLITLRGLQRVRAADVVFYDRLADPALLAHARPGAELVDVGKSPGCHPVPQDRINRLLVISARQGLQVVRLKCGDPGIFGRGAEEAAACAAAGISCETVPGVTSASAASASAGGFLTERGQTDRVVLVTGHGAAGPRAEFAGLAVPGTTLVIYMGLAGLAQIAAGLLGDGWPADAGVEIVSNAQTPDEAIVRVKLRTLAEGAVPALPKGPAIILVRWPLSLPSACPRSMSAVRCAAPS